MFLDTTISFKKFFYANVGIQYDSHMLIALGEDDGERKGVRTIRRGCRRDCGKEIQ